MKTYATGEENRRPTLAGQSSRSFSFDESPFSVGQSNRSKHVVETAFVHVQVFNLPMFPLRQGQ